MKTNALDYELPPALIAQHPCEKRDASRLMVVRRDTGAIETDVFKNIANYLAPGDCMVLNDTRVIRARLHGHKESGGHVEVFLLRELRPDRWVALVRPSARVKPGTRVLFDHELSAVIEEPLEDGRRCVRFNVNNVIEHLEQSGIVPLPPYIKRSKPNDRDATRYQTIYAAHDGAVAAPTAGLHFTEAVFDSLAHNGITRQFLTLHVGYGTFKPVTTETLEAHRVDSEPFELSPETADSLNTVRRQAGRVVAVGTTCTRALETVYADGCYHAGAGTTDLYIYPPYRFQAVDALQTNFHLPKSSLLALVCAFAGRDLIMEAYEQAVRERFRFYSYGDAMLIL